MRPFQVKIFKIECFEKGDSKNIQNIVYFCQNVVIGAEVYAYKFKNSNSKIPRKMKSRIELCGFKGFQYQYKSFVIKYQTSDFMGEVSDKVVEIKDEIYHLTLNNIRKAYEHVPQCFPNTNTLELSFINYQNSLQERKYLKSQSNIFLKCKDKSPLTLFSILYKQFHVAKTEIWSLDEDGFCFLADGVLYGPFEGIVVTPFYKDKAKKGIKCMTFFPVV